MAMAGFSPPKQAASGPLGTNDVKLSDTISMREHERQMECQQYYISSLGAEHQEIQDGKTKEIEQLEIENAKALKEQMDASERKLVEQKVKSDKDIADLHASINRKRKEAEAECETAVNKALEKQNDSITKLTQEVRDLQEQLVREKLGKDFIERRSSKRIKTMGQQIIQLERQNEIGPNSWIRFHVKGSPYKNRTYVQQPHITLWDAVEDMRHKIQYWDQVSLWHNGMEITDQKITLKQLGIKMDDVIQASRKA